MEIANQEKSATNRSEYYQGLLFATLSEGWKEFDPECPSVKSFVAQYMSVAYSTWRRRIRASEWLSVFGLSIEEVLLVDPQRANVWRPYATEENYLELWEQIKALSDQELKEIYCPDKEDPEEEDGEDDGIDEDEAFAEAIKENCFSGDLETDHSTADGILVSLLIDKGFPKTAMAYKKVEKKYA